MERYVVHKGVYCQVHEIGWRVRVWENQDTGQRETLAWKKRIYVPLGDIDDPASKAVEVDQSGTELEAERKEAARLAALERSRARAKRNCRWRIKSAGSAQLLTCTYRENMHDFDQVRADWKAFWRKVVRYWPGARAVFAFERQDRGAWHVHAAIDALPPAFWIDGIKVRSWDLLRRLWRSVVGEGNIDVDGHRKKNKFGLPARGRDETIGRAGASLAKLAGYVSKYLTKDFGDGLAGRNRWGSTQNINTPPAITFDMPEMPLADLIAVAFDQRPGETVAAHRIGGFGKLWALYTERPSPPS